MFSTRILRMMKTLNFLTEVRIWMTEIQIWTTNFMAQIFVREFEWLFHQIEWQICKIDRENLYYAYATVH